MQGGVGLLAEHKMSSHTAFPAICPGFEFIKIGSVCSLCTQHSCDVRESLPYEAPEHRAAAAPCFAVNEELHRWQRMWGWARGSRMLPEDAARMRGPEGLCVARSSPEPSCLLPRAHSGALSPQQMRPGQPCP